MTSWLGCLLAVLAVVAGWRAYGWQGVVMAVSVTVFWLLLQFSRALRAMKQAAQAPVGHVPSAVMLNSKLQRGMTMVKVIGLTRSLGLRVADGVADGGGGGGGGGAKGEVWRWQDDGASHVTLHFSAGKLQRWQLERPAEPPPEAPTPAP